MNVSIVVPVFNEKKTILKIIDKINKISNIKKRIIIVDDGSTDGTRDIIKTYLKNKVDTVILHKKNIGKGAAIISSIKKLKGEIVIIQDADLEYDPKDYYKLLEPFRDNNVKVVYGSRVLNKKRYSINNSFVINFRVFSNHILTIVSNLINNQKLTDAHTCYKILRINVFNFFIY